MNKVIKRNGQEVDFSEDKIRKAIQGANSEVDEKDKISKLSLEEIVEEVVNECEKFPHALSVEDIQNLVEEAIMDEGYFEVARHYIKYRYNRELARKRNSTDETILSLIDSTNEEIKQENSNKNPVINSTQRDYTAGEVSKDISRRILLPKDVIDAHDAGIIHFHDMDYFMTREYNCFSRKEKFITKNGMKSFEDFNPGDKVEVLSLDGKYHTAIVKSYGEKDVYDYTFYSGKREHTHTVRATENHRWILKDGSETTNLKVGDKLIKPPVIYKEKLDWDFLNEEQKLLWCKGFALGDGTVETCGNGVRKNTKIHLCGDKRKYIDRFRIDGCNIRSPEKEKGDPLICIYDYVKEIPIFDNIEDLAIFFNGLYCADGSNKIQGNRINYRLQSSKKEVIDFIRQYASSCGLYITKEKDLTGQITNYATRDYTINFSLNPNFYFSYTVLNKEYAGKEEVWCLEVDDTHNFILQYGIPTGNCCLINLEDMLQNGTVISGTGIDKPHSFRTACNVATQIVAQVASNQYGGQTFTLSHLAPFVRISKEKIYNQIIAECEETDVLLTQGQIDDLVKIRLEREIAEGVQTIQYQVNTLMTTNGQAPFVSVMMYLNEDPEYKEEVAMIIEEILKQRILGTKNEKGVYITPTFPKLLYVLEEDNIHEGDPYFYLTKLAAKCTAKRMVPDYISEKKMKEYKLSKGETEGNGDVYPCMGCRSFLTPDRSGNGFDNVSRAKNYNGKPKYYGRFNQGVVTINLPYIGLLANKDKDKFWELFDKYLELCHKALQYRHKRLEGTVSDSAPILWQNGAIARLEKGETIDKLLHGGYSTISLGYAGLYECVKAMTGKSHTDDSVKDFALSIMQHMNDKCQEWKEAENIDYSLYGTPLESTTYKFAKALQKKFGLIEGITDKNYITNSYHVHVAEKIDAFTKLKFESEFQKLSPGGAISYIEIPNMSHNLQAVIQVIQFIYDNIMYAELNTKSDYCQVCGFDGEIKIVPDENGKLIWRCPNCGNTDQSKMNVVRRTCGYLGSNFWNQGRTQEILDRVLHLSGD